MFYLQIQSHPPPRANNSSLPEKLKSWFFALKNLWIFFGLDHPSKNWGPHTSLKIYVKNLDCYVYHNHHHHHNHHLVPGSQQGEQDGTEEKWLWLKDSSNSQAQTHFKQKIANSKPHPGAASSTISDVWLDFEGAVLKVAGGPFKCEHCHC